jgi:hypothetical protein
MDRPLVEIMLTVSLLGVLALTITSATAQHQILVATLNDLSMEKSLSSATSAITNAAAEASTTGETICIKIAFPYAVTLDALQGFVYASNEYASRKMAVPVEIFGKGTAMVFKITAYANKTVILEAVR